MRYAILSSVDKLYNENCIRHWISEGNKQRGLKTLRKRSAAKSLNFEALFSTRDPLKEG